MSIKIINIFYKLILLKQTRRFMYVTKEKARGAEPREPYKSKSVFALGRNRRTYSEKNEELIIEKIDISLIFF